MTEEKGSDALLGEELVKKERSRVLDEALRSFDEDHLTEEQTPREDTDA